MFLRRFTRLSFYKRLMVTSVVVATFFLYQSDVFTYGTVRNIAEREVRFEKEVEWKTSEENISSVYDERKNTLLGACSLMNVHKHEGNSETIVRDHFVVDRRNKILYCGMEKVGCTFWKRFFQITSGVKKKKSPFDIRPGAAHDHSLETLRHLHFDEILHLTNTFTKFIFVREPYSRIFSGYVDKIFSPISPYFQVKNAIAKLSGRSFKSNCAPFVSFGEFLHYILNTVETKRDRDGHFMPMYDHCRPCSLQYNIIGKMETFTSDVEYVIESQNLRPVVEVNFTGVSREADTIIDTFKLIYSRRVSIEKCMPFVKALKLGWRKLQIRGLIEKQLQYPSKLQKGRIPTQKETTSAALKASKRSDPVKRKANKLEALKEAFQSVSAKDLAKYREIFKADFKLFGYDIEPKEIFDESVASSTFSFFEI